MPGTTTTIDREQRDGLYELVRNHLGGIGDIWVALEENREYVLAEQMGLEFGEDFRLLQDLGWEPEDKRKKVDLTMEPHDLTELLTRLRGEAESVLEGSACIGARSSFGLADLPLFGQARKAVGDGTGRAAAETVGDGSRSQRAVIAVLAQVGKNEAIELAGAKALQGGGHRFSLSPG